MDSRRDRLHAIHEQMRELAAYSGAALPRVTVEGLAREAREIVAACDGPLPPEASAVGFALLELTEADLMSGRRFEAALPYWLALGPVGWCIASSYLFKNVTYFPVCEKHLNTLAAADRWRLLQQIFCTRKPRHQALDEWVMVALHADDDAQDIPDMAGVVAFLEEVAASGAPLRQQVKGALSRMGAAKRLDILLRNPVRKTPTASLAHAALALRAPLAPSVLAEQIAAAPEEDLAPLFALAACAQRALDAQPLLDTVEERMEGLHHSGPLLLAGLRALLALAAQPRETALLRLLRRMPGLTAPAYVASLALDSTLHASLAASLPDADRAALDARAAACLIKAAPDIAAGIAQALAKPGVPPRPAPPAAQAKALALLAASHANRTYTAPAAFERLRPNLPAVGEADKRRQARSLKDVSKTLAAACGITGKEIDPSEVEIDMAMDGVAFDYRALMAGRDAAGEIKDLDIADAYVADIATSAKQCIKWNLRGSVLKNLTFDHCGFQSLDCEGAVMENCRFRNCRFDKTWLRRVVCVGCTFDTCAFDRTDSPEATFVRCAFINHSAIKSHAPEAVFVGCALSWCDIRDADMSGVCFLNTRITSSRFEFSSFHNAACIRTRLMGVEWIACLFQSTSFERASCLSSDAYGCVFTDCSFMDFVSDEPVFLEHERSCLERTILHAAASPFPALPTWLRGLAGGELAQAFVSLWGDHKRLKERQSLFLRNNARRLALTMATLREYKTECFELLPYMLMSRSFERRHATRESFPLCSLRGYSPPFSQRGLALRHFQEFDIDTAAPGNTPPVRIEAIYTIGSVGSLAMTKSSDIDYWVCLHPQDASPETIAALSRKLSLISHWAETTFGLETTFFVMDLDAIRRNDFGFSDKESSGSAQALLLKEEFYRTALKVCGHTLAWWLTPPGSAGEDATEAALRKMERASLGLVAPSVNMGGMAEIPPGEFFGASLWQIIKALKSPFKSILKFALLEKYQTEMRGHGSDYQLCERIKESIVRQKDDMFSTDPYAVLFKEVRDFYAKRGETRSVELIRMAFLHKLDVTAASLAGADEEGMQKRRFLEELLAQEDNGHDPAALLASWSGGVDQQIALGKQINTFMMNTYVRIQEGLGRDAAARTRIDSHDVARLGGKLVAAFSRREHKIERIPFVLPVGRGFTEFRLSRMRRGAHSIWEWAGRARSGQEKRKEYVAIKHDLDPARLLAWVVANGLYAPDAPIDCEQSAGPISARDLWKLLPAMTAFFPTKTTFDAPIDEMIEPERVLKAYFICNLLEPRERNEVATVSFAYATNRGEMFCQTLPAKHKEFRASPQQFLDRHVPQDASVERHLDMEFFTPHMSRCPKMR